MYDQDPQQNLDAAREVARHLRRAAVPPCEADILAILGGLPGTNGPALRQMASQGGASRLSPGFDALGQAGLTNQGNALGNLICGSPLTAEEVYARMAALGLHDSPDPISFHCPEAGCFARAQIMIEHLQNSGVTPEKVWAFKQDADPLTPPRLLPRDEDGQPIRAASGADVEWIYHVAPVVLVEVPGGATRWLVIDPSLSRNRLAGPVSVDGWHQQVGTPPGGFRDQTVLGQAPRNPSTGGRYPGNGYLPGMPTSAQADARGYVLTLITGGTGPAGFARPPRPLPAL